MSRTTPDSGDLGALSPWAPELAKALVSLASDIALVVDDSGVIRNVVQSGGADPIAPGAHQWVGRPWIDTVSGETRPKIETLLKEVALTGIARRREVNHPLDNDSFLPVAYTAIRLGADGPVLAVGRDLRAIAAIQKRYVDSQQEMERGYWQARQAEARYQLLFQVATDAVLVVNAESLQIVEANQAAATLFGTRTADLAGRHATFGFEHHSRGAVNELLGKARTTGAGGEIRARVQGSLAGSSVVATPFRTDDAMCLLVRVRANANAASSDALNQTLSRLVDSSTDGVVVTDSSGRILVANRAFLTIARRSVEAQVKGQPLMNWLRLANLPLAALLAKVRRDGIARHVESWVMPDASTPERFEISAALLTEGDQECIGFTLHPVDAVNRATAPHHAVDDAPLLALQAGIAEMARSLGDGEFSELVATASALVERHFIELAVQRHGGDVASAAAMLGIGTEGLRRRMRASSGTP